MISIPRWHRALARLGAAVILVSVAMAEENGAESPADLARRSLEQRRLAQLPEVISSERRAGQGPRGVLIDRRRLEEFRSLVVPELIPLLSGGALVMDAVAKPEFVWRYDQEWEEQSSRPSYFILNDRSQLVSPEPPTGPFPRGFPFAIGPRLDAFAEGDDTPSSATASSNELERRTLGAMLLWNAQATQWTDAFRRTEFALLTFPPLRRTSSTLGVAEAALAAASFGTLVRFYPSRLSAPSSIQLFREIIALHAPTPAREWKLLTIRFLGSEEDYLWLFSPALGRARQLTGSNRSDPILRSGVTPDDFEGWSAKIEGYTARFDRTVVALTPFARSSMVGLQAAQDTGGIGAVPPTPSATPGTPSCWVTQDGDGGAGPKWNASQPRFPGASPWIPTRAVFAPRKLLRIELMPEDPYLLHGREAIYLDAASQLPVYKIVFDKGGKIWKLVISGFGMARTSDDKLRIPYPSFTLIYDLLREEVRAIDYLSTEVCSDLPRPYSLNDFDVRRWQAAEREQSTSSSEK